MKKITLIMILFLGVISFTAEAQLTTRSSNPSKIVSGTRPEGGDFGIYFGASLARIQEMSDENVKLGGIPLINLKYYQSESLEFRLGIQSDKTSSSIDGEILEGYSGLAVDKFNKTNFRLSPGVAYHFSNSNLLDIYAGVSIPFGMENHTIEQRWESQGSSSDFAEEIIKKSTLVFGYDLFIGLQVFVADLPVALGVEFGITGLRHSGLEYDVELNERTDGTKNSQSFSVTDLQQNSGSTLYKDLKYNKNEVGSNVTFTISYFFNR